METGRLYSNILLTILSILAGGVVTLAIQMFTVARSVELAQQREIRANLHQDIYTLSRVANELDRNLALLTQQNFIPDIEFVQADLNILEENVDLETRALALVLKAYGGGTEEVKQRGQICSWLLLRFPRCERGYREGERAREGAKRKAQGASKKKQLPNRPGQFLLKISLWPSLPDRIFRRLLRGPVCRRHVSRAPFISWSGQSQLLGPNGGLQLDL